MPELSTGKLLTGTEEGQEGGKENIRNSSRTVVIDVLYFFKIASILKKNILLFPLATAA
jgi:hypothetical protein